MIEVREREVTAIAVVERFGVAEPKDGSYENVASKEGENHRWDYQAGAWQKNHGLRIDHFLLSPQAADRLQSCEIDPEPNGESDEGLSRGRQCVAATPLSPWPGGSRVVRKAGRRTPV